MNLNFLDTSAILNGALSIKNCVISPLSLMELENIKERKDKDEEIKRNARAAVRFIISNTGIIISPCSQHLIDKMLKKYSFLYNINDHRLLCEAELFGRTHENVYFYTSDGAQYAFAQLLPHIKPIFYENKKINDNYCGWKEIAPTDIELAALYAHPENNIFKLKTNEFVKLIIDGKVGDIELWTGQRYMNLKYSNFTSPLGEKIAPRNIEQKMLFHLLQENYTKIKLCTGPYGCGKSMLMLQHAIKGIKDGRFSKIIFIRNNIITKGSREIGFLGGSLVEKIYPYLMPIADLTSKEYLDQIIDEGILEPVPLGFLRGRDFSNSTLIFVDEAENLTTQNMQLLIGRVGEQSQLWIAGDLRQIDHPDFEKNNGMRKMIERLAGDELFGMVKLVKAERSLTSQLADKLDN